jgi:hypothetical protein
MLQAKPYQQDRNFGRYGVRVLREGEVIELNAKRLTSPGWKGGTDDLPGETFRLLSSQVAYLKLSTVKSAQTAHYILTRLRLRPTRHIG